jgi:hypothetical protein
MVPVDASALRWSEADEEIRSKRELLASCQARERDLERELRHLIELHREGKLTGEAFDRVARPAQAQFEQLQQEIPKLEAEIQVREMQGGRPADVYGPEATLQTVWPHLDFAARRELVEALVHRVAVSRDNAVRLEIAKV